MSSPRPRAPVSQSRRRRTRPARVRRRWTHSRGMNPIVPGSRSCVGLREKSSISPIAPPHRRQADRHAVLRGLDRWRPVRVAGAPARPVHDRGGESTDGSRLATLPTTSVRHEQNRTVRTDLARHVSSRDRQHAFPRCPPRSRHPARDTEFPGRSLTACQDSQWPPPRTAPAFVRALRWRRGPHRQEHRRGPVEADSRSAWREIDLGRPRLGRERTIFRREQHLAQRRIQSPHGLLIA